MDTQHDHTALLQAIDLGDRLALQVLADWYEERGDDLALGLRWILRTEVELDVKKRLWDKIAEDGKPWTYPCPADLPSLVFSRLEAKDVVEKGSSHVYYHTPSAAYLDAAAAAVQALRSCCGQLWGEGERCGECGSKHRVADFYEPAEIEIDHDVRDSIRDWAND